MTEKTERNRQRVNPDEAVYAGLGPKNEFQWTIAYMLLEAPHLARQCRDFAGYQDIADAVASSPDSTAIPMALVFGCEDVIRSRGYRLLDIIDHLPRRYIRRLVRLQREMASQGRLIGDRP